MPTDTPFRPDADDLGDPRPDHERAADAGWATPRRTHAGDSSPRGTLLAQNIVEGDHRRPAARGDAAGGPAGGISVGVGVTEPRNGAWTTCIGETLMSPEREPNADLLLDLAEAIVLGYPVIVVIGEVPGDERETEVLTSSHFDELDQELQAAFIESAIAELRNTM
jgi:hypothetical protein